MQSISPRAKFIELCEGIFRELGFPPPPMLHEESLPLAMEMEIEGLPFELLHTPTGLGSRVLVICRLGEAPTDFESTGASAMLKANLSLVRSREAAFGISPDSREICCMYYEDLDASQPAAVLEKMRRIAPDALSWKEKFCDAAFGVGMNAAALPAVSLA